MEPFSPWINIYSAVARKDFDHYPAGGYQPEEKMSVYDAVCMFTKNLHYAAGQEQWLGTLETGKFADLVVIDRDIFEIPEDDHHGHAGAAYLSRGQRGLSPLIHII